MQERFDRYFRFLKAILFLLFGGWGVVLSAFILATEIYRHSQGAPWNFTPFYKTLGVPASQVGSFMPVFGQPAIIIYAIVGILLIWESWRILKFKAPMRPHARGD